jgi:hypothetical protein
MPPFERCSEAVAVGAKEGTRCIGVKVWQKSMLRVGLLVSERLPREGGGGGGAARERARQFVTSHRKSLKREEGEEAWGRLRCEEAVRRGRGEGGVKGKKVSV